MSILSPVAISIGRAAKVFRQARGKFARLIAPKSSSMSFYPAAEFCQIPRLGEILEQFLGQNHEGVFVEVGANDGYYVSNSWGLAVRGWRGLCIEPIPELAQACKTRFTAHPNITVLERAVTEPGHKTVHLHVAGALTTADLETLAEYTQLEWAKPQLTDQVYVAPASTLDHVLEEFEIPEGFDVLIVDVEGHEPAVFRGFSINRFRPRMMIVEIADVHPHLRARAEAHSALSREIRQHGYRIVFKDFVNTIFVRQDVWAKGMCSSAARPA